MGLPYVNIANTDRDQPKIYQKTLCPWNLYVGSSVVSFNKKNIQQNLATDPGDWSHYSH